MGGRTLSDGSFLIAGIPEDEYTVRVMMMRYRLEEKSGVRIVTSRRTRVDFKFVDYIEGKRDEGIFLTVLGRGPVCGAQQVPYAYPAGTFSFPPSLPSFG